MLLMTFLLPMGRKFCLTIYFSNEQCYRVNGIPLVPLVLARHDLDLIMGGKRLMEY